MAQAITSTSNRWDRAGVVVVSTGCAIHCAVLPCVAGLLPVLGLHDFADEWVEWLIIGVVATSGSSVIPPRTCVTTATPGQR
jgi:hypothetical protein